jgi:protein-L-isoaspartate(D-aspartate) O-methyltransferase
MDVATVRARFAEEMCTKLGLRSKALVAAFASVPREAFVGPGPWLISDGEGYQLTPDADPRHLYADVLVALDRERELNNGKPGNTTAPNLLQLDFCAPWARAQGA